MLVVISPAKTLDFETPAIIDTFTQPQFLDDSAQLIARLRELDPHKIGKLMTISDELAQLNFQRNLNWSTPFSPTNAKPAVLAFRGDVYLGLQAETFAHDDFQFAQQHLRILSGLYGLLCPLDLIQPYRLEMGTALSTVRGKNLYAFWGNKIALALQAQLQKLGAEQRAAAPVLVNLASEEYFKAVHLETLEARVVTPIFKERKGDSYKIVSFYAKRARGMMARYIIRNQLREIENVKCFTEDGYRFDERLSSGDHWVFTRDPLAKP